MWEFSRILKEMYSSSQVSESAPTRASPSSSELSRRLHELSDRVYSLEQSVLDLVSRYERVERVAALLESYEPYLRKLDSLSDLLRRLDEIEQKISSIQCNPPADCKAEVDLSPVLEELASLKHEILERVSYSSMSSPVPGLGDFTFDTNPSYVRGDLRRKSMRRKK